MKTIGIKAAEGSVMIAPSGNKDAVLSIGAPIRGVQAYPIGFDIWRLDQDLFDQIKPLLEEQRRRTPEPYKRGLYG